MLSAEELWNVVNMRPQKLENEIMAKVLSYQRWTYYVTRLLHILKNSVKVEHNQNRNRNQKMHMAIHMIDKIKIEIKQKKIIKNKQQNTHHVTLCNIVWLVL